MSTPGTIQSRAIQLALAEKGYKEGKRNWTKFSRDSYPDVQNQAWCGSFVGDVYRRAGWDSRGLVWMPYVPYIEAWAKKIGAWKTSRAQSGDIVVYGFGRTSGQHTGIAYPDESTGGDSYRAIEGNTSSGDGGSQTNGDGVYVRYRKRRDIRGWVDINKVFAHYKVQQASKPAAAPASKPKPATSVKAPVFPLPRKPGAMHYYGPDSGPRTSVSGRGLNTAVPGDVVKVNGRWMSKGLAQFQARLIERGWKELAKDGPDGRYGDVMEKVVKQFQKSMGQTPDGKIGPDTWAAAWNEPVR